MIKDFPIIPSSNNSLSRRRLVHGVGVNDSVYNVRVSVKGKLLMCPFYMVWTGMLERCYSSRFHKDHPTYSECYVCEDWLKFSVFKEWMSQHEWEGMHLDKDIKISGNKVYSPSTCMFVHQQINKLLIDCGARRGKFPTGVCIDKQSGKFKAQCSVDGRPKSIGLFPTPELAREAYVKFKTELVMSKAIKCSNPLRGYLIRACEELK